MAAGLTIKAKLDKLCPLYDRWDNLYGSRQNINPSNTVDSEDLDDEDANVPDDVNHEDFTQETFLGEAHGEEMVTLRMVDDDEPGEVLRRASSGSSEDEVDGEIAAQISAPASAPQSALGTTTAAEVISRPPRPASRNSKAVVDLNPQLTALAAATAKDAANSGETKLTKRKSDFSSLYTVTKQKEIDMLEETKYRKMEISKEKLEFAKEMADKKMDIKLQKQSLDEKKLAFEEKKFLMEMDHKKESMELSLKQSTKKEIIAALIHEGKSPTEIKEYLEILEF